jgi:PAS domain S-box-containing protein
MPTLNKAEEDRASDILAENESLRQQLAEAQETLRAIQHGEVDALIVSTPEGEQVYSIAGAEKNYRVLIEEMKEGAVMLSEDKAIIYCNNGFAKIVKQSLDTVIGKNITNTVNPTHLNSFNELIALSRKDGSTKEKDIAFIANDGTVVPAHVSVNSSLKDNLRTTFLVITDLTQHMQEEVKSYTTALESEIAERKKAEEALQISEEKYRQIVETAEEGIWTAKPDGTTLYVNQKMAEMLGYMPEQMLGRTGIEFLVKGQKPIVEQTRKELEVNVRVQRELKLIRKDGSILWTIANTAPLFDENGKHVANISMHTDISDRKKAEEALRLSEERFAKAFNLSPFAVIMTRLSDGAYIDVNDTFLKMFGYSRNEVIGHTANDLKIYSKPNGRAEYLAAFKNGHGHVSDFEVDLKTKTGKPLKAVGFAEIINVNGQDVTFGTLVDITERKQAEKKLEEYRNNLEMLVEERTKQLKDSERLAAIGATAGMVGHDIRNPLQAIISDVFLARNDLEKLSTCEEKESVLEGLSEIEKNVDYINKIVADLQDYSKVLIPVVKESDLEALCNDILLKNGTSNKIDTACIVDSQAKTIMSDPDLLKRILTNLVTNAVNAMPNGGKLTLHAFKQGGDIVITVKDTGVGIPEENKTKMFTPLFTTRAKGQGFGLPVVKRMTEALGGEVTFESQVGKGTTFTVRLPPQGPKR